jgi:hypothetical protein
VNRVVVTRAVCGICHMQVCATADATDEEVLEIANRENPSGTSRGWASVVREGEGAPVPCESEPQRIHLLVRC